LGWKKENSKGGDLMSISTLPDPTIMKMPPAVPTEPIWRLSVDRYHEMIRAGILTDDDPVELLEG
jgi:hypothetical protein